MNSPSLYQKHKRHRARKSKLRVKCEGTRRTAVGPAPPNRARDLVIHRPAHRGANGVAMWQCRRTRTTRTTSSSLTTPRGRATSPPRRSSSCYCCLVPPPPLGGRKHLLTLLQNGLSGGAKKQSAATKPSFGNESESRGREITCPETGRVWAASGAPAVWSNCELVEARAVVEFSPGDS